MVAAKDPGVVLHHPIRPPLTPSEKDNATISSRRPKAKEITSRYLSSSSSTSTSSSSNSSWSSTARRHPSPLLTPRPSTPTTLSQSKRSHSVDRSRPATPKSNPQETGSNAARALCTMTRSLSVSFQGESFFYQTSKAKAASNSPSPMRKPTPERRRLDVKTENSRPAVEHSNSHSQRWPAARSLSSSLTRSLDCSDGKKDSILASLRFLQQSSVLMEDGTRRVSFDGQMGMDSDSDSVSSGSNSGANEISVPPRSKVTGLTARGISVPARFWQETNSRLRRLPEPGIRSPVVKKNVSDSPVLSPRSVASPSRPARPSSPRKVAGSPARGMSPLRGRASSSVPGGSSLLPGGQQVGNAPSIISFAAEVRRAKKGESRIEEAHLLRLLDNRHLQWRWINARANAAQMVQRLAAEKNLYYAWLTTSELRDSVTRKRIKLQLLTQSLKLTSILEEQMTYLEEWSHMDRDHVSSLSGATEALKASTLRLPVVGGARADLQEVKDAVSSAVDVMQAMGTSICSLLSKVEGTSSLVTELSEVAEQERGLLNHSRDLLSTVAALHVKQCSLRGHSLQLRYKPSQVQV